LTRFQVSQIEGLEDVAINFFDIWGLEGDNYKDDMLLDVLGGKLPDGYTMRERTSYTEEMKEMDWEKYQRRIHSVLVFMPIGVLDNPKMVTALINNLKLCVTNVKVNPILVVTRASLGGDLKQQEIIKTKIAQKFNMPAGSIYMVDNYTTEQEKTMRIDKKTLEILLRAITSCRTFQTFYRKSLLEDIKKNPVDPIPPSPTKSDPIPPSPIKSDPVPTPSPPSSSLKCKCGESVEPSWDECPVCGESLKPQKILCANSHCKKELQPKWAKCPVCKTPAPKKVPTHCPKCQEAVEPNWDECPVCDYKLK